MRSGIQKNEYDTRDFSFERSFGVSQLNLPEEYNADTTNRFPDQNKDGYPNGCSGYTQNATGELEYGIQADPSFVYANTLVIADLPPHAPVQVRDSFKATKIYGLKSGDTDPLTYRRGNYYDVDKVGDYFDGARTALYLNREHNRTLSVGTPWFKEWAVSGGIIKAPKKYVWDLSTIGHNYQIVGWKVLKGEPHLIVKPWLGKRWGDGGYGYISREIFNKTMAISGTFMYIQVNYTPDQVNTVKLDILELLLSLYRRLFVKVVNETPPMEPTEKQSEMGELLLHKAKECIGKDLTPKDEIPDDVSCVAQIQEVHRLATGSYIGTGAALYNTGALYRHVQADPKWRKVTTPLPGDMVLSPTGYSTKGAKNGHVGIVGETHILSNTSKTGKWEANYTLASWEEYYAKKLGFPVTFWRHV